jgi:RNA polymerase sigma-70 factor (ECF subfamily)
MTSDHEFAAKGSNFAYRETMTNSDAVHSPEVDARRQIANLLEAAIAKLPETFRVVFVLCEVEGLSFEETAEALQIPREIVKARLVRARRKLQQELDSNLRNALAGTFTFAGSDCDALTERVLAAFTANERKL